MQRQGLYQNEGWFEKENRKSGSAGSLYQHHIPQNGTLCSGRDKGNRNGGGTFPLQLHVGIEEDSDGTRMIFDDPEKIMSNH